MLGLALDLVAPAVLAPRGPAAAASAGTAATAFATAPAVHYHPHSQAGAVTKDAGGRITACPDLRGLAAASQAVADQGPQELVDAVGRRFWRFEGSQFLDVATALVGDIRAMAVFAVMRWHHSRGGNILSMGNAAAGTAVNTGGAVINATNASGVPPYLRGQGRSAAADAANARNVILGSQLQVGGVVSRTTANGDQRLYVNTHAASAQQGSIANTSVAGAEIGRNAYAPGTAGNWARMDLYELVVFTGTLTNTQADAIAAALVANWGIAPITHQLVLEGDSITDGIYLPSGRSPSMMMSDPGSASAMPEGWRVIDMAGSGNTTANLLGRRDATDTLFDKLLPGRNVIVCQVGRNNVGLGGQTGAQAYAAIVPLLHSAGTGYLERGWEVRQAINIATGGALMGAIGDLRTLLRAPTFLTDCAAGAGQAYEGRLGTIELPLWTVNGDTVFDTGADATDLAWYLPDSTHPAVVGSAEMVKAYRAGV